MSNRNPDIRRNHTSIAGSTNRFNAQDVEPLNIAGHISQPTPIGKLLKIISELPEIRQEKVETLRHKLDRNQYDIEQNLDYALDRILEELLAD